MVADSTKDSRLFHGSLISRGVLKKRKANLLMKLRHCKVDAAARRSQYEEEEEAFVDDASDVSSDADDDDYSDAFNMFNEEDPSESNNKNESTDDQKKEEDVHCPLCDEEMDETDLAFEPCSSCEYKICLFCYTKIKEGAGVCPGCRKKYEDQQTTSSTNSGGVSFQQQRGGDDPLPLSSSFRVLDSSDSD